MTLREVIYDPRSIGKGVIIKYVDFHPQNNPRDGLVSELQNFDLE